MLVYRVYRWCKLYLERNKLITRIDEGKYNGLILLRIRRNAHVLNGRYVNYYFNKIVTYCIDKFWTSNSRRTFSKCSCRLIMCKCNWTWYQRTWNRAIWISIPWSEGSQGSLEWMCIVHMAQPYQRWSPQTRGKPHSESEAEQQVVYSSPQVGIRILAITSCLFPRPGTITVGLRHWNSTWDSTLISKLRPCFLHPSEYWLTEKFRFCPCA